MKAAWIQDGIVTTLPLPIRRVESIDTDLLLAWAHGETPPPPLNASSGLRTLYLPGGGDVGLMLAERHIGCVVSGAVAAGKHQLEPGDLYLSEPGAGAGRLVAGNDCRLLLVQVADAWPPGIGQAEPISERTATPRRPQLKSLCMYDDGSGEAKFAGLGTLFDTPGVVSPVTPLLGFRFVSFAGGLFMDWHPEDNNNLVFVLEGTLELRVGEGGCHAEKFDRGNICLAADCTGQGHIDITHGETAVMLIVIDDRYVWETPELKTRARVSRRQTI